MKNIGSIIAALGMLLISEGQLLAEEDLPIRNCTFCHGPSGQGFMLAPRLAGQRPQYIEKQLGNFIGHIRDNPYSKKYMWNAAANLSPERVHEFAAFFAAQPPRPVNDGRTDLAAIGKEIFEQGVPTDNVVACIVCHAPNGEGVREIPRLGGQSYIYLKRRLDQWNEGYHQAARPMPQIAKSLSEDQIEALASYLSFIDNESPQ